MDYVLLWSYFSGESPLHYQKDARIKIHIEDDDSEEAQCFVDFQWCEWEIGLTCTYHPSTDTFENFKVAEYEDSACEEVRIVA